MAAIDYVYDMIDTHAIESSVAPMDRVTGTNVIKIVVAYDDTTIEYRNGKFLVPGDLDTAGTVTFTVWTQAKTGAASKNVVLRFDHIAIADDEDHDGTAYTSENSGDQSMSATQDHITVVEWTETVSNLGWAADDLVYWRLSRQAAASNDLSGDLYVEMMRVNIPTS